MTRRNTRSTPTQPGIEPKAAVAVARKTKTKIKPATTSRIAPEPAPAPIQSLSVTGLKAPSDKLATLLMPVEVHLRTQDRTPLSYLLKPLDDQLRRTFRAG